MAVNLSPVGGVAAQFFDNDGNVLSGGKLYTYLAGTTTPAVTYTTSQGNIPWTNPVVLDAAGRVPSGGEIWLTDGIIYKFVLKDSNDVLIATYDNITGINSNAVAYTNQQEIVTATAGQTVFNLGISYQPGTNSLSVFVDGVNQYGPGAQYSYVETDANTVTFNAGLHVGAEVKFTTTQQQGAGAVDASQVSYTPAGTGAVTTNVQTKLRQTVSIKDFGAVGDGWTNDTAALQAAATYAANNDFLLQGAPGTYKINSTWQLNCSGDLSEMAVIADATIMDPAIQVGPASGYLFNIELSLPKLTNSAKTTTGWSGFSTKSGVALSNLYQSRITVKEIRNFGIGLTCGGHTAGCVYNTVTIGILANNKCNLRLKPQLTTGWANQNLFIGGRYFHDSSEGVNIPGCYHIQTIEADYSVTDTSPNNNLFLNPSIEGTETEYQIYLMGAYNQFVNARFEPAGKVLLIGTQNNMTRGNLILGGYDSGGITYTVSGGSNVGVNQVLGLGAKNTMDFSGTGVNVRNSSGTGLANPHFQGFSAGTNPINKDDSSTDWMYRLYGQGFAGKRSTDTHPILQFLWDNSSGYILFGNGSATPSVVWTSGAGSPEGAITGSVGSLYTRTDGGAGTTLYVKESGTGNTGWSAK